MKLHRDEGEHLMDRLSKLMLIIKDSPFNSQVIPEIFATSCMRLGFLELSEFSVSSVREKH
jgi:hypothetical protein